MQLRCRPYSAAMAKKATPKSNTSKVHCISYQHTKRSTKVSPAFIDQLEMVESQQSLQNPLSCLATNNPTLDTSPLDTLHKHLPRKIMTDKEALYEENLALKHNQNRLRENN